MKNSLYTAVAGLALTFATSHAALAITIPNNFAPTEKQVFCAGQECGTMKINTYEPVEIDRLLGGVKIDGYFLPSKLLDYHYIQVVTVDDAPLRYIDKTALPIPYVDTPPGGYFRQPFDYLPYYDEGEFPRFSDEPNNSLLRAIGIGGDGKVNVKFETWLVCTIEEVLGADLMMAKDDKYKIAPLLGWTWGYDLEYMPDGIPGLDFSDFIVSADPFNWQPGMPSNDWKKAASKDTKYGNNQDFWDINSAGDCKDCKTPTDKDFGDSPETYKTLLPDGPRYLEGDLQRLGSIWDREQDGQPSPLADGDDLARWDDEDGVIFGEDFVKVIFNILRPTIQPYQLRAWWDLNRDGKFNHPTELKINDLLMLSPGEYSNIYHLAFNPRDYPSRFRLTWDPLIEDVTPYGEFYSATDCTPALILTGQCVSHGEVEDYAVPGPLPILGIGVAYRGLHRLRGLSRLIKKHRNKPL